MTLEQATCTRTAFFERIRSKRPVRRGVSPEVSRTVWDMFLSFSGYSFCKPHSASFRGICPQGREIFPVERVRGAFPAKSGEQILGRYGCHESARFNGCAPHVRQKDRVGELG